MPIDFLSDAQAQAYAQFSDDLSTIELAQFFYLDAADQVVLTGRRGPIIGSGLPCRPAPHAFSAPFCLISA